MAKRKKSAETAVRPGKQLPKPAPESLGLGLTESVAEPITEPTDECAGCHFSWEWRDQLLCRRLPPLGNALNFPIVHAHWWCGEYKPRA